MFGFLKKASTQELEKQILDELKEEGINKIIVEINITEKKISKRQGHQIDKIIISNT